MNGDKSDAAMLELAAQLDGRAEYGKAISVIMEYVEISN